jgi:membrane protein DedA with SNARE-associated domain
MRLKLLAVFGLGMTGLWQGVPAGFALQMHPVVTGVTAAAGSFVATLIVVFLGDRLRERLLRRKPSPDGPPRERLIDRVWRRYGVVGLGLLGPGLTGAPLGAALGLSLRVPARQLLTWLSLGIVLWSFALTLIGIFGTVGILRLLGRA